MGERMKLIKETLLSRARKRIIFPEISDVRVLRAADRLAREGIVRPIYIGSEAQIEALASRYRIQLRNYECFDPASFPHMEELIALYKERRPNQLDESKALTSLKEINRFSTMLVYAGYADGLVSGASQATSAAVLPALQIIKAKRKGGRVSGAYLMLRKDEQYIFADCAINIAPDSDLLAEITLQSAETARLFQMEPKVAMLSFSTKGSASSKETERIIRAVKKVKALAPDLLIDGEIQFDAAYVPELAERKGADLSIRGDANVFIFPNLEAGNISCKIAERLAGFQAIGPILQGLNRPVNLLSRGCSEDDIYHVALVTALQASQSDPPQA